MSYKWDIITGCGPEGPTEVKRREARILVLQLYLFSEI